jgi:hypothetical protein
MSWWEYNRNWMLVVGVIIALLVIVGVAGGYHGSP